MAHNDIPQFGDVFGAIAAVERLRISKRAKKQLQNMLAEASTFERTDPERTEPTHKQNIQTSMERYTAHTLDVVGREGKALRNMAKEEWDRLVAEANEGRDDQSP